MLPRIVLPSVVLILAALMTPARGEESNGGFRASIRDYPDGDRVELSLDTDDRDHWTLQLDRDRFTGLDGTGERDEPVTFTLAGDAGTVEFQGDRTRRRRVEGRFRFTPDVAFTERLGDLGYRRVAAEDLLAAVLLEVDLAWIEGLHELGYRRPAWDDLIALRVHGARPEFLAEMAEAGFDLDLDDLIAFRDSSLQDLVAMRIHGHY